MVNDHPHIVLKSVLEIDLPHGNEDPAILEELKENFYREFLPAMEKVFDELGGENRLVRLDHLEIDLGDIENLRSGLSRDRFESLLREKLREEIILHDGEGHTPDKRSRSGQEILWYMEYGTFPWWSRVTDIRELEGDFLSLVRKNRSFVKQLEVLFSEDKSLRRFSFSFSDDFFRKIIPILLPSEWKNSMDLYLFLLGKMKITLPGFEENTLFRIYSEQLFFMKYKLKRWDLETLTGNVLLDFFRTFFKDEEMEKSLVALSDLLRKSTPGVKENGMKGMVAAMVQRIVDKQKTGQKDEEVEAEGMEYSEPETDVLYLEDRLKDELPKRKRKFFGNEQYIDNAGLVLLYPYLKSLFERTGVTKDHEFDGLPGTNKGLFLLHYLVRKDEPALESKMLLNKVLCGLPEDYPSDPGDVLTEKDTHEAEEVLKSLIRAWKVLKNTSPDGFREAFLQRDGILEFQQDHWKLIIERKSIDMLLESLPYALGMIRLPWMKQHLIVEW